MFTVAIDTGGGVQKFAHSIQLTLVAVMCTNIVHWIYNKCSSRSGRCAQLPVIVLVFASALMLLQPISLVVNDSWGCAGRFSADQIHNGVVICTGRDRKGLLIPEGCQGYYEMDGTFRPSTHTNGPGEVVSLRQDQ